MTNRKNKTTGKAKSQKKTYIRKEKRLRWSDKKKKHKNGGTKKVLSKKGAHRAGS